MIPWMLVVAHARRARLRTLLTAGSVAVALFLYCSLRTVVTSIDATVKKADSGRLIVQNAVSLFASLRISMWSKVRERPGVRASTHWTWFGGVYKDPSNFFARFGVDVPSLRQCYGDLREGPDRPEILLPREQWEAFQADRTGCIVGADLVRRFRNEQTGVSDFEIGSVVPLVGTIYPGDYRFTVRGIYRTDDPAFDQSTMFFHWDYMDETVGRRGTVSTFTLDLADRGAGPEIARAVDEEFRSSATRTRTLTEQAFNAQFIAMWGNLPLFLSFIGGAILFSAFMVTLNTLLLNARERVTEVGVLKTLGFRDGAVGVMNLAEGVVLAVVGAAAGSGAAWAMFRLPFLQRAVQTIFPNWAVLASTVAEAMAIGLAMGLVSGALPGILAARLPVVRALRRVG